MRGANLYWRRTGGEHMIGKAARVGNPVMEVRDFGQTACDHNCICA